VTILISLEPRASRLPTSTDANPDSQVCDEMLALKDNCVHPETKQPYVKTGRGGKDNSPEGRQVGSSP
jgi:hypothetical protein